MLHIIKSEVGYQQAKAYLQKGMMSFLLRVPVT